MNENQTEKEQNNTFIKQTSFISSIDPNISTNHTFRIIKKRMPWSEEEDKSIKKLVNKYGTSNWTLISNEMGQNRSGKQCRERWYNQLKPNVKKNNWTDEEENILFTKHMQLGNKWSDIASYLPGRTLNDIKNHFYSKLRKFIRKILKQINDENLFKINGIDGYKYTGEKIYKMIKKHEITYKNLTKDTIFELIIATEKNPKGKFIFCNDYSNNFSYNINNNPFDNNNIKEEIRINKDENYNNQIFFNNNNYFSINQEIKDKVLNEQNNNIIHTEELINDNSKIENIFNYKNKKNLKKKKNNKNKKNELSKSKSNHNNTSLQKKHDINIQYNLEKKIKEDNNINNNNKLIGQKRKKNNSKKANNLTDENNQNINNNNNINNIFELNKKNKKNKICQNQMSKKLLLTNKISKNNNNNLKEKNKKKNVKIINKKNINNNVINEKDNIDNNNNNNNLLILPSKTEYKDNNNNNNFCFYPPFKVVTPKTAKHVQFPLSETKSNKSLKPEDFSFNYYDSSQMQQMFPTNIENILFNSQKNKNIFITDLSFDNNLLKSRGSCLGSNKNDNTYKNYSLDGNLYNKLLMQSNINNSINNNTLKSLDVNNLLEGKNDINLKKNDKPSINLELINHQDFTNTFINGNMTGGNESQFNSIFNKNNPLNIYNSSPSSLKSLWK